MDDASILAIERPHKNLLILYFLTALCTLFLFPFVFVPLYFRYHTLRYKLDDEGISAKWGILFHKEVYVTYRRVQDIHVSRNLVERWLGIAKVELQTAAGSSTAELSLEGMQDFEAVRDFLYGKMRGARAGAAPEDAKPVALEDASAEAVALLREIKGELEGARRAIEARI